MVLPAPATLADLLDGDLYGVAPAGPLRSVRIDSRRVETGSVFFALAGRRRDGQDYAPAALAAGAALVVVRRHWPGPMPGRTRRQPSSTTPAAVVMGSMPSAPR